MIEQRYKVTGVGVIGRNKVTGYYSKKKCGSYDTGKYTESYKDFIITNFSDGGVDFVEVLPETIEPVKIKPNHENVEGYTCPNCNANVEIEECSCFIGIERFCQSCGMALDDE